MKISLKNAVLIGFDLTCYAVTAILYYVLSYFSSTSGINVTGPRAMSNYIINALILLGCIFAFRFVIGVYFTVWRYSNTPSYLALIVADMLGGLSAMLISYLAGIYIGMWFFVTVAALNALMALAARYAYRMLYKFRKNNKSDPDRPKIHVAIVGAGQLGAFLANELRSNPKSHYRPMCFIDTNKSKAGNNVMGLRVYHPDNVKQLIDMFGINEIIVAVSGLTGEEISGFYNFYEKFGCKVKIYDSPIHESSENEESPRRRVIREFQIEDLLFRKPLSINDNKALEYYRDKVILVTGGGGSIGSEICRQLAKCHPKKLVIFDIYENNAYDIQQELITQYGDQLNLAVEIGSVRDRQRLDILFRTHQPQVVFHAAAHKHVPLMEHSAGEAIKNNVMGTYNTADMAEKYGTQKFILVSTDKAVNPTNIMGASKRMCEMVVQCRTDSKTSFAAVRFGNVLGSNGSVIPLFKRQIAKGGPITITDKRIIRYFMTIPEASQLVMQAGAMAKKGELFVLDMGKPVRIYELAENMIKLSGFVPNVDIKIEEVGLRPGEKLYEELLMKSETLTTTDNSMIFVERDTPLSREAIEDKLTDLRLAVDRWQASGDTEVVKKAMKSAVPTFHDPEEVNCKAEKSEEMKMVVQ